MRKYKGQIIGLVNANSKAVFSTLMFFVLGCIIGNVVAYFISPDKTETVYEKYAPFFTDGHSLEIDKTALLLESFKEYTLSFCFILVCSFSVYFVPLLFGKIIFDGFLMGLSSGIMVRIFGGNGFLITGLWLLMKNMFYVPVIVVFSVFVVKMTIRRFRRREKIRRTDLFVWLFVVIFMALFCSITDSYIASWLVLKLM